MARPKQPARTDDYIEDYRQSISFPDGIRKLCSGPSMPSSRRRDKQKNGGYLSISQPEIFRLKRNTAANLREKKSIRQKSSTEVKMWASAKMRSGL